MPPKILFDVLMLVIQLYVIPLPKTPYCMPVKQDEARISLMMHRGRYAHGAAHADHDLRSRT